MKDYLTARFNFMNRLIVQTDAICIEFAGALWASRGLWMSWPLLENQPQMRRYILYIFIYVELQHPDSPPRL